LGGKRNVSTVKPVYNDHPWDPKKVTIIPGVVIVLRLGKNTVCAKFIGLVGQGIQAGHCRQVVIVQWWQLAQV